jgi:UrcA family protein
MSKVTTKGLLVLSLLTTSPLYAQPAWDDPPSRTVSYSELDLARPAADEKLYQRVKAAAREVCRGLEGRELGKIKPHQDCVDSAIGRAVVQVNHPKFTAYYAEHNPGKSLPAVSLLPPQNGALRVSKR